MTTRRQLDDKGGLFAVDTLTGKLKWTSRPAALRYGLGVFDSLRLFPEALSSGLRGTRVVAVSLETGKEIWRGLQTGSVGVDRRQFRAGPCWLGEDIAFYALDVDERGKSKNGRGHSPAS